MVVFPNCLETCRIWPRPGDDWGLSWWPDVTKACILQGFSIGFLFPTVPGPFEYLHQGKGSNPHNTICYKGHTDWSLAVTTSQITDMDINAIGFKYYETFIISLFLSLEESNFWDMYQAVTKRKHKIELMIVFVSLNKLVAQKKHTFWYRVQEETSSMDCHREGNVQKSENLISKIWSKDWFL